MRWLLTALFVGAAIAAALGGTEPVDAKLPPFSVKISASPTSYSGACPVTIKFTGAISGDPGSKLQYQIARVIGGVPNIGPWTSATMTATGTLLVPDTVVIAVGQAGLETETLRVLPGPAEATVKVPVTCATPSPTPTPTKKPNVTLANPGISTVFNPSGPTSPKTGSSLSQNIAVAPALHKLPAPTNLTQRLSKDDCAAHGGSAESFACYLALPAGKPVLDWDYPYPDKIDGFNIYRADTAPAYSPTTVMSVQMGGAKPVMTQNDSTLHFEVLESARAGSCFAVTAFHGTEESDRSIRFCVASGGTAKMVSLQPDRVGAMVQDWFYYVPDGPEKFYNEQPNVRDLLYIVVGVSHDASTWSDNAHTNVTTWTNSRYVGYAHFNTSALNFATIAQAKLNLRASSGGETCLAYWGPADHLWNPGDRLGVSSPVLGGSNIMGPNLSLDVTSIVQGWASAPGSNTGFAVAPEQSSLIWKMILLSSSCTTSFPTATLDVTYY